MKRLISFTTFLICLLFTVNAFAAGVCTATLGRDPRSGVNWVIGRPRHPSRPGQRLAPHIRIGSSEGLPPWLSRMRVIQKMGR